MLAQDALVLKWSSCFLFTFSSGTNTHAFFLTIHVFYFVASLEPVWRPLAVSQTAAVALELTGHSPVCLSGSISCDPSAGWDLTYMHRSHRCEHGTNTPSVYVHPGDLMIWACVCLRWMSVSSSQWHCDSDEMQTDLTVHQSSSPPPPAATALSCVCVCVCIFVKDIEGTDARFSVCSLVIRWF